MALFENPNQFKKDRDAMILHTPKPPKTLQEDLEQALRLSEEWARTAERLKQKIEAARKAADAAKGCPNLTCKVAYWQDILARDAWHNCALTRRDAQMAFDSAKLACDVFHTQEGNAKDPPDVSAYLRNKQTTKQATPAVPVKRSHHKKIGSTTAASQPVINSRVARKIVKKMARTGASKVRPKLQARK